MENGNREIKTKITNRDVIIYQLELIGNSIINKAEYFKNYTDYDLLLDTLDLSITDLERIKRKVLKVRLNFEFGKIAMKRSNKNLGGGF